MADFDDFMKVDIRAGKIVRCEEFPRARNPSYKIWVDFGPEIGVKATSAQVTKKYSLEDLPGRHVLGAVNLGERNIAGFISQFLLLGLHDDAGDVHLVSYQEPCLMGARLC